MKAESWSEIEALVADAADLAPQERAALLALRCAGRPDLHAEVQSLLAAHDQAGGFLRVPTQSDSPPTEPAAHDYIGATIGRFRLVERIGEGGMGLVYRAVRADGAYAERVAVKLLAASAHHADALRRFRIERQALATLSHPDIVTLIDGGIAEGGQAYLAMQFVDGVPITDYCAAQKLSLEARIALLQRVCSAVQHAHESGVVHRDLKPSNLLVTADGAPKVLDFGIAKLLAGGPSVDATGTALVRPLTPNYASPEQLRGLPVTTSCDIYALGVLLYEIVAGARPYDTTGLPLDAVLAIVAEQEPPRPSVARAAARPLPYPRMRLRGDLDAILLRAMHKDPAHRYASARELSEDLGRHLAGQPVLAREPSLVYYVGRLARRHRPAFAAAAISIVALLSALGVSVWQTRIARAERDRAAQRFNDVRQLANTLIFKIHDEVQPLAGSTPVRRTIVNEALGYLERLRMDPAADEALRLEMGKAYARIGTVQGLQNVANLGDREGALASLRQAVALFESIDTTRDPASDAALELGNAQLVRARIALATGKRDEAREALGRATAIGERAVAHRSTHEAARRLLGSAYFNMAFAVADGESAMPHWERAGRVFESLLAERPDDPDRQRNVALVEKYLGGQFQARNDLDQALAHYTRALELDERRLSSAADKRQAALDFAIDLGSVAGIHAAAGRLDEATVFYERSRDIRRNLAESDPKNDYARGRLAYVLDALADMYSRLAKHREALDHASEAVRIAEDRAGVDAQNRSELADYLSGLSQVHARAGRQVEACRETRRAREIAQKVPLTPETNAEHRRIADEIHRGLASCGERARPSRIP